MLGAGAATLFWLLVAAGIGALVLFGRMPSGIRVGVEAPERVRVGESFRICARVHNEGKSRVRLGDLDFSKKYLGGIAIRSSTPPWSSSSSDFLGATSYSFGQSVEPGAELEIVLQAQALRPGDWAGDVDFWFFPGNATEVARTEVVP